MISSLEDQNFDKQSETTFMFKMLAVFFLLAFHLFRSGPSASSADGTFEPDRVEILPGATFDYSFQQFTGFLNASTDYYQHYLHYWLVFI